MHVAAYHHLNYTMVNITAQITSAFVVSIHVWTNQTDHVWLVSVDIILQINPWIKCKYQYLILPYTFARDRLSKDDAIGTTFLNLSKMSCSGGEIEGNYVFFFLFIWFYTFMYETLSTSLFYFKKIPGLKLQTQPLNVCMRITLCIF